MKCNMDCKRPEVQYLGDLPIDSLESVADFFLAERDIEDERTGNTVRSIVRVPGSKLFPNANMDNIVALVSNNTAIKVPNNQVRAVYVANEGGSSIMKFADKDSHAVMLAVGEYAGMILVQSTGFANIPEGHNYIIGVQYYVGENGEPVTSAESGIKLFTPVSRTKLLVDIREA